MHNDIIHLEAQRLRGEKLDTPISDSIEIASFFVVELNIPAEDLILKIKSVFSCLNIYNDQWLETEKWNAALPEWLVPAFTPDLTEDQMQTWIASWRKMSRSDQIAAEEEVGWSLANWLYWIEPQRRQLFWFDAKVIDHRVEFQFMVIDSNNPTGYMDWLIKVANRNIEK